MRFSHTHKVPAATAPSRDEEAPDAGICAPPRDEEVPEERVTVGCSTDAAFFFFEEPVAENGTIEVVIEDVGWPHKVPRNASKFSV